jgi:hypothetical protein
LLLYQRLEPRGRPCTVSLSGDRRKFHEEYSGRHAALDLA